MRLLFYISVFIPSLLDAQAGQWTWMKGSNTAGQWGNYGTLGVPAATNVPGARYESGGMRDSQNNFWLFGGSGYDHKGSLGILTDLWKYDPSSNNWTWMKGDSMTLQLGVYGTKGVSSPSNKPGQRFAFVTWDELNGALWLWGGNSYNDLWKYDIATNEWTWMTGANSGGAVGTYGTKGVAAAGNTPGSRGEITCSWTDSKGNLWLFGGSGYATTASYGMLNDLWMYNPGTNMWTWVSGDNVINQAGIYGTLGVPSPGNKPGGRQPYNCWIDSQDNLWLFGGVNTSLGYYYNDLWMYNTTTGEWTWMSGSNLGVNGNTGGNFGAQCVSDSLYIPTRRFENKANWVDGCGNLWTYGGGQVAGDLWVYNTSNHKWTWASGDNTLNTAPVYGTQGIANPANKPGAREGAPSWKHSDGSFWIFGGGYNSSARGNDLWRYFPDTNCAACSNVLAPSVASFQASDTSLCANDCISFTNLSVNSTSWNWTFQGGLPPASTDQNPSLVCYLAAGTYSVKLVVYGTGGSDSLTISSYINVDVFPLAPGVTASNDTLYSSYDSTYIAYQWYADTTLIAGATLPYLKIDSSGNYNVKVTNKNGCSTATGINIILGTKQFIADGSTYTIYPNPVGDWLTITSGPSGVKQNNAHNLKLSIYNVLGENIYQSVINNQQSIINVSAFAPGVYFVQVASENGKWISRFVKE